MLCYDMTYWLFNFEGDVVDEAYSKAEKPEWTQWKKQQHIHRICSIEIYTWGTKYSQSLWQTKKKNLKCLLQIKT